MAGVVYGYRKRKIKQMQSQYKKSYTYLKTRQVVLSLCEEAPLLKTQGLKLQKKLKKHETFSHARYVEVTADVY